MIRIDVPDSHGEHIDLKARAALLSDVSSIGPDEIVLGGDHLDCGGVFSVHQRSFTNEMAESYEADVAAANSLLDELQKRAPRATIYYLEGNHEQHVERWAVRTFQSEKDAKMLLEKFGPEKVLHLRKRGIRYYRRSEFYMGISIPGTIKLGKCFFVHGITHSKNAAAAHLARFGANVVFHHTHRSQAVVERTVVNAGIGAWCAGTLAKLQPLYRHTEPSNWSHGYGLQHVLKSGSFCHLNIPILDGQSMLPKVT